MSVSGASAAEAAPQPATRRRSLGIVLAIVFIDLVGFGVIIPILPFDVRSFGVSNVFIGLLAASYSLLQFGFAPPCSAGSPTSTADGRC